jgi:hypothetical protein
LWQEKKRGGRRTAMLSKAGAVRIRLVSGFEWAGQGVLEYGVTVALAAVAFLASVGGLALAVSGV